MRAPDPRPGALIFRKRLLPWSETFIANQGGALERYRPVFVGYRWTEAGPDYLRGQDVVVLRDHALFPSLAKGLLKATGHVDRRWRRALAERGPALVHAHFGVNALDASALARTLAVPLVVTYHGSDIAVERSGAREEARRRRIFAAADRILAVSEFIAERLRAAGCPPAKLTVHRIGVDTARFAPGPAEKRVPGRILFVGRLVPKKGLIHLIRAVAGAPERVPAMEVLVAGDGPLRRDLEGEATRLRAPVRFLGVRTPDQVRSLMREASVFCAPSVVAANGDAEGLPMTIVEAQASGLPVVAFPSGGSAEGLRHGETGWVLPPGDEAALAEHLVLLLSDDARRASFAAAARAFAVEHFDLRRQTATLERIYDDVRGART